MTIQLVFTGYLLVYLFANSHPLLIVLATAIMLVFAINNIIKRI
ncbi:MAG: hypothetical protein DDT21_02680 [Syntrophomonadaceae bacterium]|nr:hypothetical protein [Bacillota bacterium]